MAREDAAGVGFDHQLAEDLGLDHFMHQARQPPRGRRGQFAALYRTPDDLLSCCILVKQGPQAGRQLAVGAHSVDQAAHHGREVRGEVGAHGLHHGQQVSAQAAGVMRAGHAPGDVGADQFGLARPAPVDRGLAGVRPGGHGIHRHRLIAGLAEQADDSRQDRPLARLASRPACIAFTCGVSELGHPSWPGLLCGSLVFVDEPAEDGPTLDTFQRQVRDGVIWPGRVELAAAMGSPPVVVGLILS
jgi:hypothetical protein